MKQYREATPQELEDWHNKEGKYWADRSLSIVAIASVFQVLSLGFLLLSFKLIQILFS